MVMLRNKCWAAAAALMLAGCSAVPQPTSPGSSAAQAPVAAAGNHGAAMDLGSKFKVPNRERGRRGMAIMNKQYQLETEADEQGPPTAGQIFRAHEQREALVQRLEADGVVKAAGIQPGQWQEIGPSNVAGRIRAIAFDPSNTQRVFVGTASGGLWISEDRGVTWRQNHDFLPNLSISTLAFDPANARTVYLGTGEYSAGLVGVGA